VDFTGLLKKLGLGGRARVNSEVATARASVDAEFLIPNMVCEGCAEKIGEALHAVPGVQEIRPNVQERRIRVRYEPATIQPEDLKAVVREAGFTAVDVSG